MTNYTNYKYALYLKNISKDKDIDNQIFNLVTKSNISTDTESNWCLSPFLI